MKNAEEVAAVLPKGTPAVSKVFRKRGDGIVEKVFVDHDASPRRSYPTGEMYRIVKDDESLADDQESVVVFDEMDFTPHRYVRMTSIDGCIFPAYVKRED